MNQRLSDEITSVLSKAQIVQNLARQKFMSLFVLGVIKSRNVQFCEIAHHLNDQARISSNEVRIQDFFREVELDYGQVAMFLVCLLPPKRKLRICIDRTNWEFGKCCVNILMLTAGCGDYEVPLYWEILENNGGNSSCQDRTDLLDLCLKVVGVNRIGYIVGDREFIGHKWLKYLKNNNIDFIMRMPKHHSIESYDGRVRRIADMGLSREAPSTFTDCLVDGVVGDIWAKRLEGDDFLFLFGTVNVDFMGQLYRKRWGIECFFQSMKGRGFDLEKTHLKSPGKLSKLVALVSIAYGVCRNMGIYYHVKVQKIKTKKHGYKGKSFVRKGIDLIRQYFRNETNMNFQIERTFMVLIRWIKIQITDYQQLKIAG
jgi:hypothetical protein